VIARRPQGSLFLRAFTEGRGAILDNWRREQQQAADKQSYAALLKKDDSQVDEHVKPLRGPLTAVQEVGK
jgi:hypothetical protein